MGMNRCASDTETLQPETSSEAETVPDRVRAEIYLDLWEVQLREAAVKDDLTGREFRRIWNG
ncbi:hypothetical protein [Amaricoccus tamworthensis]|uniref:hypothetical protein n=1 Tax=Amaricoccus tamworthensis TaxID=57002 RepID=UPI003C7C9674